MLDCASGEKVIISGIFFKRLKAEFKDLFSLQRNDKFLG